MEKKKKQDDLKVSKKQKPKKKSSRQDSMVISVPRNARYYSENAIQPSKNLPWFVYVRHVTHVDQQFNWSGGDGSDPTTAFDLTLKLGEG